LCGSGRCFAGTACFLISGEKSALGKPKNKFAVFEKMIRLLIICILLGCGSSFSAQPLQVSVEVQHLTCATIPDGSLRLGLSGGRRPVQYVWADAEGNLGGQGAWEQGEPLSRSIGPLPAGHYTLRFTGADGATLERVAVVESPDTLVAEVMVQGEICLGYEGASIQIQAISGGIPPYRAGLEGEIPGGRRLWTGLAPDTYLLNLLDASGCRRTLGIIVPETATDRVLELGPDQRMPSGDSVEVYLQANFPIDSVRVSPEQGVRFISPNRLVLTPEYGQLFQVVAFGADGCGALDEIFVDVYRDRRVFVPNVFAPADPNPANAICTVFADQGVRVVLLFRVLARSGAVVHMAANLPPGHALLGWDGRSGGMDQPAGVYLWEAVLRYTDGREKVFIGEVTLVR